MKLRLRFFASHRDALGQEGRPIKMPEGSTAQHLFDRLASEHPALAVLDERTLFAVNHEQAGQGRRLKDGDEVALYPPVGGG